VLPVTLWKHLYVLFLLPDLTKIGLKGITYEDKEKKFPEASSINEIDTSKGTFAEDGEGASCNTLETFICAFSAS